jgi:hypothetical protein
VELGALRDRPQGAEARLAVGQALVEGLEQAVRERELPWQLQFRKGYVALQRPGCADGRVEDVYWRQAPRLALKLPGPPTSSGWHHPSHR